MAIEITDDGATILYVDTSSGRKINFNKTKASVGADVDKNTVFIQEDRQIREFKFSDVTIPVGPVDADALRIVIETMLENSTASGITIAEQSSDATVSRVEDTVTSTTLIAANVDRILCIIKNDSGERLFLRYGSADAADDDYTESLQENQTHFVRSFTGEITGIWSADGTGGVQITEVTR